MHLRQCLEAYLEVGRVRGLSPRTLWLTGYQVRSFLNWLDLKAGVTTADQLDPDRVEAWLRQLASRTTLRGGPLKPRSINKNIQSVRGFLKALTKRGMLAPEVSGCLADIKEPHLLPTSVLHHAQMQQLLLRATPWTRTGARDRALLELLYSAGLRSAEVLALNLEDVDWTHATALVTGKGSKQRVVPIGRTALRHLDHYVQAVRPGLLKSPEPEPALFLDVRGRRLPYHVLRRLVKRYGAGFTFGVTVTPHTFRRSCATELIRAGANLYHVKELLGHESLETLKHYARLTIDDLKATHARCHPQERD